MSEYMHMPLRHQPTTTSTIPTRESRGFAKQMAPDHGLAGEREPAAGDPAFGHDFAHIRLQPTGEGLSGGAQGGGQTGGSEDALPPIERDMPPIVGLVKLEASAEREYERNPPCVNVFNLLGPDTPTWKPDPSGTGFALVGHFGVRAQFSRQCHCGDFEYRQFIRGTFQRRRGGAVTDLSDRFGNLYQGQLTPTFDEDANVRLIPVFPGHRDEPAATALVDRYTDERRHVDQRNGCNYALDDRPFVRLPDAQPGDQYDAEVNFRGVIQQKGKTITQRFWSALKGTFTPPTK